MKSILKAFAMAGVLIAGLSSSTLYADGVSFNYQGRVKVQGQAFNGTAQLKFAILSTNEKSVLWSNDGTVGVGANPNLIPVPSNFVTLPVTDGVFSVQIGDTSVLGMAPLDSAILVSDTPLKLRVWFNDGSHGFEELKPDFKLLDLTLNKIQTGLSDYTIYVNGTTGDDLNNGLTTSTAKKTISGAVDIIPDKVRCNITVDVADGVYPEMVSPNGISVAYGKRLAFEGDLSWDPKTTGMPSVVIDGSDNGTTPSREFGFYARQCSGIEVNGFGFTRVLGTGIKLENGSYKVSRCCSENNNGTITNSGYYPVKLGVGFHAGPQGYVEFKECRAKNNTYFGFVVEAGSRAFITTCTATQNDVGVFTAAHSTTQFFNYNNFSANNVGVQSNSVSDSSVWPVYTTDLSKRTNITGNTTGVVVNWGGIFDPSDANITGNGTKYLRYYGKIIGVDPQ